MPSLSFWTLKKKGWVLKILFEDQRKTAWGFIPAWPFHKRACREEKVTCSVEQLPCQKPTEGCENPQRTSKTCGGLQKSVGPSFLGKTTASHSMSSSWPSSAVAPPSSAASVGVCNCWKYVFSYQQCVPVVADSCFQAYGSIGFFMVLERSEFLAVNAKVHGFPPILLPATS